MSILLFNMRSNIGLLQILPSFVYCQILTRKHDLICAEQSLKIAVNFFGNVKRSSIVSFFQVVGTFSYSCGFSIYSSCPMFHITCNFGIIEINDKRNCVTTVSRVLYSGYSVTILRVDQWLILLLLVSLSVISWFHFMTCFCVIGRRLVLIPFAQVVGTLFYFCGFSTILLVLCSLLSIILILSNSRVWVAALTCWPMIFVLLFLLRFDDPFFLHWSQS